MIKKLIYLVCFSFFLSCNVEEKQYWYEVNFKNTSNMPFHLLVLGDTLNRSESANDTLINAVLNKGETSPSFSYYSHSFKGFKDQLTYIRIEFINENRGYICSKSMFGDLCFITKINPIYDPAGKAYKGNDKTYSYEITQEDYENAHVLP